MHNLETELGGVTVMAWKNSDSPAETSVNIRSRLMQDRDCGDIWTPSRCKSTVILAIFLWPVEHGGTSVNKVLHKTCGVGGGGDGSHPRSCQSALT